MINTAFRHEDVLNYIEKLPYTTFKDVVYHYAQNNKVDVSSDIESLTTLNLQKHLEQLGINQVCPSCGSNHIVKNGKRKQIQRYKCKPCKTQFTLFTNTILEKTKWHWNVWVQVLEMMLNNYSLDGVRHKLIEDYGYTGLDHKTAFLWRHKIVHALGNMPQPVLSGVVQVDETFIRESQKGARKLTSYIGKDTTREPRYGRQPSKMGVMGPEFANVTTAIDNTGHCVCHVVGLGPLTNDLFTDMFENHLNDPAYICSDGNKVYYDFCNLFSIPHYKRPSNYNKFINENGYVTPSRVDADLALLQRDDNHKILKKLYANETVDMITNKGYISYDDFHKLKKDKGLNLARVNGLHKEIKHFIYRGMTNVSTKYLKSYIGYFTYLHNWKVDHGNVSFSRKDAEAILIEIIKYQTKFTTSDLQNTTLDLPKPSSRYVTLLKKKTRAARKTTDNNFFKFDTEDNVVSFDKRKYLSELPASKLKSIYADYGIKHRRKWSRWSNISEILKRPDIDVIILKLIDQDKVIKIYDEDLEYMKQQAYKRTHTST